MKRVALLLSFVAAPALAAGSLPKTVVPVAYDISVRPDAKALTFTGSEDVIVDVKAATRRITLNAADLTIGSARIDGKLVRFTTDVQAQTLTLTLPKALPPGQHKVSFAWRGKIGQSAAGLFAIDYTNADGTPARMLATQFEAPDARRFAPMWDEPAFKATFKLSATVPAGQTGFSNMPAASIAKRADGTQIYHFGETPVMSSYLLFFGMGDVERRTVKAGATEIGVITRRGVSPQGDYALASAKRLLSYYNDYFGQPYPLPKMDMIAGPGSSQFFGAMENWGAIFYFEPELLFDSARATESGRQRIHTVVAHEIAHQWFGDLVTMRWWDDLWLNEGFASWMEGKASGDLNPSWKAGTAAIAFERESAMAIDATAATHPIIRKVETVDQIGDAFDSITYLKGQAVIGMLEATLGADVFRDGIRRYMAKYRYGNTETDQLWAELSAASGTPVAEIAHDFTLQGGVPLISVTGATCAGGATTATMTQGRFAMDAVSKAAATWHVPLIVATLGGGETRTVVSGAAPTGVSVKGCGTLVVNRGKGSYARVLYDAGSHDALVRDYARLPLEDRLGTLGDDFALAAGGYQDLARWVLLSGKIGAQADPLEWSMLVGQYGRLATLYQGTPLDAPLRARTIATFGPVLAGIGYEAKAGGSTLTTNLREALVARLGGAGDPDVAARARRYVGGLARDPLAIPPAIRDPILSTYAVNATPAEWDALLKLTRAETNPVSKNEYVTLLGAARDDALAGRALALLETDTITAPQKASLLRAVAIAHPDMAFDWAVAHRTIVEGFVEASTRSGYIVGLGGRSSDPAMPGKIKAFADANLAPTARAGADRTLASIAVRKAAAETLRGGVTTWLGR